ncbi:MAG TPA: SpoIIE family protein phosphatase, partial [Rectinemataceae bacterium]|nr:SpoIIE family protein phosphatase [Rectinemataceae bacterium]
AGKNGYALLAADVSGRGVAVALLTGLLSAIAARSRPKPGPRAEVDAATAPGQAGPASAEAVKEAEARLAAAEAKANEQTGSLNAALSELNEIKDGKRLELRMSGRVQRRVVPRTDELPSRPEISFNALYAPSENTGGDIFDVVRAGKNGYALLAADVSGRGVAVALLSALVKNAFRSRAAWGIDPATALAEVNAELVPVIGGSEHYVSAFFGFLNLETGELAYSVAGHPACMLLHRRNSEIEDLSGPDPALGVIEEAEFHAEEASLEEGDRILLFTDGVTGARNYQGEAFGRDRLAQVFTGCKDSSLAALPPAILEGINEFTIGSPHSDDIVALACEFRSFARDESANRRLLPDSDDYLSLSRRGAELAAAGKIEEAIRVYQRVLMLEPEDAKALNNIGTLFWRMGRRDKAAEKFKAAARLDPNDPRITRNLALVQRGSGKDEGTGEV